MRVATLSLVVLASAVLLVGCRTATSDGLEREIAPQSTVGSSTVPDAFELVGSPNESVGLILEPALVPAGYQECRRRDAPGRVYIGYCDDRGDLAIEIEQTSTSPERESEESVPELPSSFWTTTDGDTVSLATPLGPGAWIRVSASDLPDSQVVRIAESIPMVGDRGSLYPEYRLPIDVSLVTVDDVSEWFAKPHDDIYFELSQPDSLLAGSGFGGPGGVQLSTSDAAITSAVRVFAQEIHQPRLLRKLTTPTVGGEAPDGLSRVAWSAGGVFWYLSGHMPLEELADVAQRIQVWFESAS